jgi:hypothetical protein
VAPATLLAMKGKLPADDQALPGLAGGRSDAGEDPGRGRHIIQLVRR